MVKLLSSSAVIRPKVVIVRAVSLICQGSVRIGVLSGGRLKKIINPARILPSARRLIGLIRCGLFSLIVISGENRGLVIMVK